MRRMKIEEFIKIRERFLNESEVSKGNEKLYEFLADKYVSVNEGVFQTMVSWFRRNFSPKAKKIINLGNEYYDWLMTEYNAKYKGKDSNEREVDRFLKEEKISADIEQQITDAAGDNDTYKELSKKIILENKLKAKKDFSQKILGFDSQLAKSFESEYTKNNDDIQSFLRGMSKDEVKDFETKTANLTKKIVASGRKKEVATVVSCGLMIYFQNRLNDEAEKYTEDDLFKAYDNVEDALMRSNKDLNTVQGAEILSSIRSLKDLKQPLKKGSDMKEQVTRIIGTLREAGIDKPFTYWGLTLLFIKQKNQEQRDKAIETIKKLIEGMKENEMKAVSDKVETRIDDIVGKTDSLEKQDRLIDDLEKEIEDGKFKEKKEETPEKMEPEQNAEGAPEEKVETNPKLSKMVESIPADAISNAVKSCIVSLASAESSQGDYFLSDKLPNDALILSVLKKSVALRDPSIVKTMNDLYVEKLDRDDLSKTTLKDAEVTKAVESLTADYKKALKTWGSKIEKSSDDEMKAISEPRFFIELFLAKGGKSEPLADDELKKDFFKIFDRVVDLS